MLKVSIKILADPPWLCVPRENMVISKKPNSEDSKLSEFLIYGTQVSHRYEEGRSQVRTASYAESALILHSLGPVVFLQFFLPLLWTWDNSQADSG